MVGRRGGVYKLAYSCIFMNPGVLTTYTILITLNCLKNIVRVIFYEKYLQALDLQDRI